jgi:hypothetical protein
LEVGKRTIEENAGKRARRELGPVMMIEEKYGRKKRLL